MSLKERLEKWLNYAVSAAIYEGMDDDGLEELRQVRQALERYILVHESHVRERCEFDEVFNQHLCQVMVAANVSSWVPEAEVTSYLGQIDLLKREIGKHRRDVLRYLEQPEPPAPSLEQTQPDQP